LVCEGRESYQFESSAGDEYVLPACICGNFGRNECNGSVIAFSTIACFSRCIQIEI